MLRKSYFLSSSFLKDFFLKKNVHNLRKYRFTFMFDSLLFGRNKLDCKTDTLLAAPSPFYSRLPGNPGGLWSHGTLLYPGRTQP